MSSIKTELIERYGKIYTTDQATEAFEFKSRRAPYAVVIRKSGKQMGSLRFTHQPRYYFDFKEL